MLSQSAPTSPAPPPVSPPPRLSSRKELFSLHVARGASLAQAARLAGYSPQGARQRGSVLMADGDVRLRVEALRHAWMAERQGRVDRAIEQLDRIIDMAMELQRPTAALKAMDMQLKLTGVIRDTRAGLYADSPDDDLSKVFFDPREDEDPDFNPDSYPAPVPAAAETRQGRGLYSRTRRTRRAAGAARTGRAAGAGRTRLRPCRKRPNVYICGLVPPINIPGVYIPGIAPQTLTAPPLRVSVLYPVVTISASPGPASPGPMSRVER